MSDRKRRAPELNGENGETKRQEMDKRYCVRLLIPTKLSGKIIGKRGAVATGLRQQHCVSLNIPDSNCPERLVHIRGDDLDGVVNCVQEIGEKIQAEVHQIANLHKEGETEIRALIHKSVCGAIIGKGGSTIDGLRQQTGTAIRMNGDCCPGNSTDRVCQIAGQPGNVGTALESILNIIENANLQEEEQWYNVADRTSDMLAEKVAQYGGYPAEEGAQYGRPGGAPDRPRQRQPYQNNSGYGQRQEQARGPPPSWTPPPNYPYPMPHYQQPHGHYPPPPQAYSPYAPPAAPHAAYGAPTPYYPPPPSGAYAQPTAGGDYYRQAAPQQPQQPYGGHHAGARNGYDRRDNRDGRRY